MESRTRTFDDLRRRAEIIRDETQIEANTAQRVGQLFIDIIQNSTNYEELDGRFLRKDINDVAHGYITFDSGWMTHAPVRSAVYNIGWEEEVAKGFYISNDGGAWFTGLNVRGPILGDNVFGSPFFASGWTGFGTELSFPQSRLELDHLFVRKDLKVYELVVNQVRGTNGSLAVTDSNKIESVEDGDDVWICTIDDMDGEMYMNLRAGDVIRCQTWEQLSGKYYMATVTRVGDNWFEVSKSLLEGMDEPAAGDTVFRWSNDEDEDRKGLLYLTSSDSGSPYLDVRYGDWDATVGSIKARLGRLDGINDPAFPELYGAHNNFGLYTSNFYGTGELILRSTGESISRTFEVLKDSIKMGLDELRYEMRVSEDSILTNPIFQDGVNAWEITNVIYPWVINGGLLTVGQNPFVNFISGAVIVNDPVIERTVLQVADSTVTQRNDQFTDAAPNRPTEGEGEEPEEPTEEIPPVVGKYAIRFKYRSLLNFGTLEVGIPDTDLFVSVALSEDKVFQNAEVIGEWDGTGDFIIKVTNGSVNITDISFTADKLANAISEIKVEYDTKLTFYAEKAVMNSFRDEYDAFNQVVRRDYATHTWTYNAITSEVGIIIDSKLTYYSTIEQTATMIRNAIYDENLNQYATTIWTSTQIANTVRDLNLGQYATTTWTSSQIQNEVSGKASLYDVKTMLTQTAYDYTIDISAFPAGVKDAAAVSQAFFNFSDTGMSLNRRIEVGTGTTPENFVSQGGISANIDNIMLWTGGTYQNAIYKTAGTVLRHDGSGYFAKRNIEWDISGNTTVRGTFESNISGNKVKIDATDSVDKVKLLDTNDNLAGYLGFNQYMTGTEGQIGLGSFDPSGAVLAFVTMTPQGISFNIPSAGSTPIAALAANSDGSASLLLKNLRTSPGSYPPEGLVYRTGNVLNIV